ncbi:hypothetical protein ACWEKM_18180 [Streptomyces sp. NPDC004752]
MQAVPDAANRSLALAEPELPRNPRNPRDLHGEFRGNVLPDELYSRLVRNGAVMDMKNTCSPTPHDVKIVPSESAARAWTAPRTPSKERHAPPVRVLGHRRPKRLWWR